MLWVTKIFPLVDALLFICASHITQPFTLLSVIPTSHIKDPPFLQLSSLGSHFAPLSLPLSCCTSPKTSSVSLREAQKRICYEAAERKWFCKEIYCLFDPKGEGCRHYAGVWVIPQARPPLYRALNKRQAGFNSSSDEDFTIGVQMFWTMKRNRGSLLSLFSVFLSFSLLDQSHPSGQPIIGGRAFRSKSSG